MLIFNHTCGNTTYVILLHIIMNFGTQLVKIRKQLAQKLALIATKLKQYPSIIFTLRRSIEQIIKNIMKLL